MSVLCLCLGPVFYILCFMMCCYVRASLTPRDRPQPHPHLFYVALIWGALTPHAHCSGARPQTNRGSPDTQSYQVACQSLVGWACSPCLLILPRENHSRGFSPHSALTRPPPPPLTLVLPGGPVMGPALPPVPRNLRT